VSVFYLYTYLQLTDGLQTFRLMWVHVCKDIERERVTGRLGTGRFRLFRPLGRSISFRALSAAALLIGNLHH